MRSVDGSPLSLDVSPSPVPHQPAGKRLGVVRRVDSLRKLGALSLLLCACGDDPDAVEPERAAGGRAGSNAGGRGGAAGQAGFGGAAVPGLGGSAGLSGVGGSAAGGFAGASGPAGTSGGGSSGTGGDGTAAAAGNGGAPGTAGSGGAPGTAGSGGAPGTAGSGAAAGTAGSGGAPGTAGNGSSAGAAGKSGGPGAAGKGGAAGAPVEVPPNDKQLAKVVTLDDVAVFQALKVDVAVDGKAIAFANRNAPIVAGRGVVVRAYIRPIAGAGFSPRTLWAELTVERGANSKTFTSKRTIDGPSADADPDSVFQFEVPAALVGPASTYRVSVLDPAAVALAGANSPARFPRNGSDQALGAVALAGSLSIRFVPVHYTTGTADTRPDLSAARLKDIREYLHAIYPVDAITLSVREEIDWNKPSVNAGNFDFGALLPALRTLKTADKAAPDTYYVAVVVPAPTYAGYCGGSCENGRAYVVKEPTDAYGEYRVGGVVGYWDEGSLPVLAHELGHLHGRNHSPCATTNDDTRDKQFPFADGGTHVWGYDERTKTFIPPSEGRDLMGNCKVRWMSSYTSQAIFERLTAMAK